MFSQVGHFAGPVEYSCEQFLDKNRDAMSNDLATALATNRELKVVLITPSSMDEKYTRKRRKTRRLRQKIECKKSGMVKVSPLVCTFFKFPSKHRLVISKSREKRRQFRQEIRKFRQKNTLIP